MLYSTVDSIPFEQRTNEIRHNIAPSSSQVEIGEKHFDQIYDIIHLSPSSTASHIPHLLPNSL